MLELVSSMVLMFLVVGLGIRWALRNGLADQFRGRRPQGPIGGR